MHAGRTTELRAGQASAARSFTDAVSLGGPAPATLGLTCSRRKPQHAVRGALVTAVLRNVMVACRAALRSVRRGHVTWFTPSRYGAELRNVATPSQEGSEILVCRSRRAQSRVRVGQSARALESGRVTVYPLFDALSGARALVHADAHTESIHHQICLRMMIVIDHGAVARFVNVARRQIARLPDVHVLSAKIDRYKRARKL